MDYENVEVIGKGIIREHFENDLSAKSLVLDAALFSRTFGEKIIDLWATYFDGSLHVKNSEYRQKSILVEQQLKCKTRNSNNLQFPGFQIEIKPR